MAGTEHAHANRRPLLRQRALDALFILTMVGATAAIGLYVHRTMEQVREGLPAQVLEQQRDIAYMVNELAGVAHSIEEARFDPTPGRIEAVRARVRAARHRLDGIRRSYNFDNLVGASAVHAITNPALIDIDRWASDGLYGRPPESPAVLELMGLRARNGYERVAEMFDQANRTAVSIVRLESERLARFRDSLFAYLGSFALLAIGAGVLFVRQRNAEAKLARERKRLMDSIESISEGFALYDRHDRLVLFNRRFREIVPQGEGVVETGSSFEDVLRHAYEGHESGARTGARFDAWVAERLARHHSPGDPFELRLPDGRVLRVSEQRTDDGGTVGVYTDVTDQKRAQERLEHLATHDPLTGLPNRGLLNDRLENAIARCRRTGQRLAVLFFDLDHFKAVNDTLGHAGGDRLLKRVAANLHRGLRENDTVVRLGGDEFAAVVEDVRSTSEVALTAERVLAAVREAVDGTVDGVVVSTSVGIAIHPEDGAEPSTLLKNADDACYHAKRMGRDNYQFYTERLNVEATQRLATDRRLRTALTHDALAAEYEPRVDLSTGEVLALEATLCWRDAACRAGTPEELANLAGKGALPVEVGERLLALVCADARAWAERRHPDLRFAVSLGAPSVRIATLARVVARLVEQAGIGPNRLTLGISASCIGEDRDGAVRALEELRAAGHAVVLDGFGTAPASLASLLRLPVEAVRLDAELVRRAGTGAEEAALIESLAALAHRLRLRVIAPGIDDREQRGRLARLGCDEGQGSLFGTPLPAARAAQFLPERASAVTPFARGAARQSRGGPAEPSTD